MGAQAPLPLKIMDTPFKKEGDEKEKENERKKEERKEEELSLLLGLDPPLTGTRHWLAN